jgi:hypothetical protein
MGLFARRQALGAATAPEGIAPTPLRLLAAVIGTGEEARDFVPFLRWLLINALAVVVLLALWQFGLVQTMLATDRTHISLLILVILAITAGHCLVQTLSASRELVAVRKVAAAIAESDASFVVARGRVSTGDGRMLEPSLLAKHIANLVAKSRAQRGRAVDQTLLLRSLADQLHAREQLGWFVAETLLRLALLGTAIGFILMLIPISQLRSFDVETLRNALAGMSGGMAIALNITVTGIASALLLKVEYYFLDQAIAELFARITEITEVHVVSRLERGSDG